MKKYVQIMLNCTFCPHLLNMFGTAKLLILQNFAQNGDMFPYAHVLKLIGFDVYLVIIPIS